jgi:hypothetical protein
MDFNWRRVLIKEYNATYIFLTGTTLLILKNLYFAERLTSATACFSGLKLAVLLGIYLLGILKNQR